MSTKSTWSYEQTAEAVMAHAAANYNKGWDVIVECLSHKDIVAEIKPRKIWSAGGAIRFFAREVAIRQEALPNCKFE
jgi:hypothetical protein